MEAAQHASVLLLCPVGLQTRPPLAILTLEQDEARWPLLLSFALGASGGKCRSASASNGVVFAGGLLSSSMGLIIGIVSFFSSSLQVFHMVCSGNEPRAERRTKGVIG